mgnify:CR=1 FL=1
MIISSGRQEYYPSSQTRDGKVGQLGGGGLFTTHSGPSRFGFGSSGISSITYLSGGNSQVSGISGARPDSVNDESYEPA